MSTKRTTMRVFDRIAKRVQDAAREADFFGEPVKIHPPNLDMFSQATWEAEAQARKMLAEDRKQLESEQIDQTSWSAAVDQQREKEKEKAEQAGEKWDEKAFLDRLPKPANLYEQRLQSKTQELLVLYLGAWLIRDENGERLYENKQEEQQLREMIGKSLPLVRDIGEVIRSFSERKPSEVEKK